ncbi:MAG: Gfo/Idh/MocA family oxidoreductase [Tetrasphaera sp.]
MPATRIAVAGAGYIGRDHIAAARASDTVELSAIVDPAPNAASVAADAGVPLYPDLAALFERDRPDGIVLATPNQLHLAHASTCMDAGVPVLIEKPLADSVAASAAIHQAALERRATVLVGHHRTHSPIMRLAREIIDSGRLGQLVAVNGTTLLCKPDEYFEQAPWRKEPGAGPILLNLIHEVHNLRILCGEIVQVQAFTSNATRGFAVEETAAVALRFANGVLGTFLLSDAVGSARSWEQTAAENPAYPTYADEDCYHVAGTLGSVSIPTFRLKTYATAADRSWWKPFEIAVAELHRADPIRLQMEHFGAVVRGEAAPLCTVADGLTNVRVVEAVRESAATGAPVDIPTP